MGSIIFLLQSKPKIFTDFNRKKRRYFVSSFRKVKGNLIYLPIYLESLLCVLLTFIQIVNSSKDEVSRGWNLTDILREELAFSNMLMSLECQLWYLSSSSVFYMSDFTEDTLLCPGAEVCTVWPLIKRKFSSAVVFSANL